VPASLSDVPTDVGTLVSPLAAAGPEASDGPDSVFSSWPVTAWTMRSIAPMEITYPDPLEGKTWSALGSEVRAQRRQQVPPASSAAPLAAVPAPKERSKISTNHRLATHPVHVGQRKVRAFEDGKVES